MTSSNNSEEFLIADIINSAIRFRQLGVQNRCITSSSELGEIMALHGDSVMSGEIDITNNQAKVRLLHAALKLVEVCETLNVIDRGDHDEIEEIKEADETYKEDTDGDQARHAGNFDQAVRPSETGEGEAPEA